jgi:hypothetical protein
VRRAKVTSLCSGCGPPPSLSHDPGIVFIGINPRRKIHATVSSKGFKQIVKNKVYLKPYFEGKCAVMTGEDTYVKASQFRRPDETLPRIVGSFHKDHARIPDYRPRNYGGEARMQKEMREPFA